MLGCAFFAHSMKKDVKMENNEEKSFLECERWWIFVILMTAAGWLGAFTYTLRGNVFCNAQTGNFVLLAMAIGNAKWSRAGYLLIPISSYFLGTIISEILPNLVKKKNTIILMKEITRF